MPRYRFSATTPAARPKAEPVVMAPAEDEEVLAARRSGQKIARIGFYIPPVMVGLLVVFFAGCWLLREDIMLRFNAHKELNGLIVGVFFLGLVKVFRAVIKVQLAANLLRQIHDLKEEEATVHKVDSLLNVLHKRAKLIDTFFFQQAMKKIPLNKGGLIFNDNEARVVKSKVGARIDHLRQDIKYWGGVLVMLGLIGTFWGLLETITAVGEAMDGIVKSFNNAGGGGDEGFGAFLGAISKPLQGMGIAFSASLFGLTGSLIVGMQNVLAGKGQNKFLEDFSLWLDERIPIHQVKDKKHQIYDELDALLKVTSNAAAGQSIAMACNHLAVVSTQMKLITQQQTEFLERMETERQYQQDRHHQLQQTIGGFQQVLTNIAAPLATLPQITGDIRGDLGRYQNMLAGMLQSWLQQQENSAIALQKTLESSVYQQQILSQLANAATNIDNHQAMITGELRQLHRAYQHHYAQHGDIVGAVNAILNTLNTTYLEVVARETAPAGNSGAIRHG